MWMYVDVDFISNHTMFINLKALPFPQPQKCLKWTVKSTEKFLIIIKVSLHCSFFFFFSQQTNTFVKGQTSFFNNYEHKRWQTKIVPISKCRVYFFTIRLNVTAKHLRKLKGPSLRLEGALNWSYFPAVWSQRMTEPHKAEERHYKGTDQSVHPSHLCNWPVWKWYHCCLLELFSRLSFRGHLSVLGKEWYTTMSGSYVPAVLQGHHNPPRAGRVNTAKSSPRTRRTKDLPSPDPPPLPTPQFFGSQARMKYERNQT